MKFTAEEMEKALGAADFRKGDHVLLRSGWGTLGAGVRDGHRLSKKQPVGSL